MKTIHRLFFHSAAILAIAVSTNACTTWLPEAHHLEIQQGNVIKQESRDLLQSGMTKQKVLSLLGKPILQDPYHPNRWDYIYRLKSDAIGAQSSRLTLFFEDDNLIRIDDTEFNPEEALTSPKPSQRTDEIDSGPEAFQTH